MVKIEIPIGAEVLCEDGQCGSTVCVILDPVQERVTHLVVQEGQLSAILRLVPIQSIWNTSFRRIELGATTEQFQGMEPFVERTLLPSHQRIAMVMLWPYVDPATALDLENLRIPAGKVVVLRETPVRATDGSIGRVAELLIDRDTGRITDLVLREGHLWAWKEVAVPVAQIRRMGQDAIELRLSKKEVQELPKIPTRRFLY